MTAQATRINGVFGAAIIAKVSTRALRVRHRFGFIQHLHGYQAIS
ncbi:hypothetical protein [Paraburkholderia bryophila]|uniref:Uncharacterized protein n=1 Tax=Paraburkholderia bryophila TaxID=420952 RepID=A0A7Y9WWK6_9BURK|nr:hypothetical protein [Paraburkholderia bryophila]NYH27391.1 hypothetical protein [Paraburkholderia bryophila]